MSLKVETISDPKKHQSMGATMREGAKKIGELAPGQAVIGTLGPEPDVPFVQEPAPPTPEEELEKTILCNLLIKWVSAPKLAKKSMPDQDVKSFIKKVRKQPLEDLRHFFNIELPPEVQSAIQKRWMDISP